MGSRCRCIEQGAECGHLPECPYFRPTPPAPADVGDDDPACTCAPLGKATCVKHAPADGIQHDMETRCPKCGQDYRLHKGDEVECVCPAPDAGAAERAVVEAARALLDGQRRDGCLYCVCGRLMTGNVAHQANCAWNRLDAALRGTKGGAK